MSIGDNLQYVREKRGVTEEELAKVLQVSERMIIDWEAGAASPDTNQLTRISDVLDVSLDILVKGKIVPRGKVADKSNKNDTKEIKKSLSKIRKRIEEIMWSAIVIIYLMMGFILDLWHPGWIIFVIGGFIESYLKYLENKSIEEMEDI